MIERHKYTDHKQFLKLRKKLQGEGNSKLFRIGASSLPGIYQAGEKRGLSKYISPTVYFYQATGFSKKFTEPTLEMLRGNLQEPIVYNEYFKYFSPENPTAEYYLENYHGAKTVYRTARKANAVFVNEKYPWLAVSPDYIISKNRFTKRGPLELKSHSSRVLEQYEAGLPTSDTIQAMTQAMVLEMDYCEVFNVTDATIPVIFQFERNKLIEENIIHSAREFHEKVMIGKKIVAKGWSEDKTIQELDKFSPPNTEDPLYNDFLKEQHRPDFATRVAVGTPKQLETVIEYLKLRKKQDRFDASILALDSKIRRFFKKNTAQIDFGNAGKISWIQKLNVPKEILNNI